MTERPSRVDRASLLIDQGRYDLAERELQEHLADAPDDARAYALLTLTLVELERLPLADEASRTALRLDADDAMSHYARARVLVARRDNAPAVEAAEEVIRLDPDHPRGYAILATARIGQRRWTDALDVIDAGLRLAPEHEGLLTLRGLALREMGRGSDANVAFESALRRDPSNAYAHAHRGLTMLHQGRTNEALESITEALRLDPGNQMARAVLIEALKARNPLYAGLLRVMLAIGRLSARATGLLLIGFVVLQQALRAIARSVPALGTIIGPIIAIYLLFAWLTFAAGPLLNLLLFLDPLGRHALTSEQRIESMIIGPLVGVGIAATAIALTSGLATIPLIVAILGLGLVIPIAGVFATDDGWPRWVMLGIVMVAAALGVVGVLASLSGRDAAGFSLGLISLLVISLSSWLVTPLSRVVVRR